MHFYMQTHMHTSRCIMVSHSPEGSSPLCYAHVHTHVQDSILSLGGLYSCLCICMRPLLISMHMYAAGAQDLRPGHLQDGWPSARRGSPGQNYCDRLQQVLYTTHRNRQAMHACIHDCPACMSSTSTVTFTCCILHISMHTHYLYKCTCRCMTSHALPPHLHMHI